MCLEWFSCVFSCLANSAGVFTIYETRWGFRPVEQEGHFICAFLDMLGVLCTLYLPRHKMENIGNGQKCEKVENHMGYVLQVVRDVHEMLCSMSEPLK